MSDDLTMPAPLDQPRPTEEDLLKKQRRKEKKLRKKEEKSREKNIKDNRVYLAYERTMLAWVRTATNLLSFGFAIMKLLQQEASTPGEHPILKMISPVSVGVLMIAAGFIGLSMAVVSFATHAKELGRTRLQIFGNPAMIVSYVILALSFMILAAAFMKIFLIP